MLLHGTVVIHAVVIHGNNLGSGMQQRKHDSQYSRSFNTLDRQNACERYYVLKFIVIQTLHFEAYDRSGETFAPLSS